MLNYVAEAVSDSQTVRTNEQSHSALQKVLYRMQTIDNDQQHAVDSQVNILDASCVSDQDLRLFLSFFISEEELGNMIHDDLVKSAQACIPVRSTPDPQESKQCTKCNQKFSYSCASHTCRACGNALCKNCAQHKVKLPRYGIMKASPTCDSCYKLNSQLDEAEWVLKGVASLSTGKFVNLWEALGCFNLALHCGSSMFKTLSALASELLSHGLVEEVLPILSTMLQSTKDNNERVRIYLLFCECALTASKTPNTCWDSKHAFLKLAQETCSKAHKIASASSGNDAILAKKKDKVESAVNVFNADMQHMHTDMVLDKVNTLEIAFAKRDWDSIVEITTEEKDDEIIEIVKKESTLEALNEFFKKREQFLEKMLPEDKFPLIFIRGLIKLQEGSTKSALNDIEKAAWSRSQADWLRKASVDALVGQMDNVEGYIPYIHVLNACKELKQHVLTFLIASPSCLKLLPTPEEIDPTEHHRNWPHLYVEGVESKAMEKYEKAIINSVKHQKINNFEAGLAYIDLVQACSHLAEVCMCFLYAAMWFHRDLIEKTSKQNMSASEKYALKNIVILLLEVLQTTSQMRLHPGMQLILTKNALGIALSTLKAVGKLATESDSKVVVGLLRSVVYNCRLCPFWNAPIVNVSEVVLLNIISGQLHCEYVLGLQYIEPDVIPIRVSI